MRFLCFWEKRKFIFQFFITLQLIRMAKSHYIYSIFRLFIFSFYLFIWPLNQKQIVWSILNCKNYHKIIFNFLLPSEKCNATFFSFPMHLRGKGKIDSDNTFFLLLKYSLSSTIKDKKSSYIKVSLKLWIFSFYFITTFESLNRKQS